MLQPFIARPPGKTPYLNYRCRKFHAAGACPAPAIIAASKLEPYVLDVVLSILRNRRRAPAQRLAAAEANADAAAKALTRYRDNDRVAGVVGKQAFADGLAVRHARLREARLAVIDLRARAALHKLPAVDEVRRLLTRMTVPEKRELVAKVVDMVFVAPGRRSAAERVTVCPAGTAPRVLPRPGDRGRVIRSIEPRRGWINPAPRQTTTTRARRKRGAQDIGDPADANIGS